VFGSWRSHYHALLKGVPRETVRQAILDGRSIALTFPEQRVLCSAIVGGTAPIANGVAWAIKQSGLDEKVYVFLGDMASETGIVHECMKYAHGHELPVQFIVEDNGMSVMTDTRKVWGVDVCTIPERYHYELTVPHVGTGKFVRF